jgi:hypothetical protein
MLLIEYFTCIGGLFGLWFGLCLENLLLFIVKHTINMKTKVKLHVEKHLFLCISSLSILHFINDLIKNLVNYTIERLYSMPNRISQLRTWFSDWLKFFIDLLITHARICRFKLKVYANAFLYFTINSMHLLIVLFLSFIFYLKLMVEIEVKKISSFVYILSIFILHCIYDIIINLMNYMLEKVISMKNKIIGFGIWFRDWLQFFIDMSLPHVRICKFLVKYYANTFFYFSVNSMKFLIVLFLSFMLCSQSIFEIQVMKLLLLFYKFFNFIFKRFNELFLKFKNYFSNNMFRTHNRVESIDL